ncbi:MAG: NADH-quinone oxidoreductase subunit C [Bacteroidales bacterium]|jgi:NADH/F420H2 dehydrogenase subunit C|nr:NADH-quinone oxidoreductase subunit C [Bacteroidales bacterium]
MTNEELKQRIAQLCADAVCTDTLDYVLAEIPAQNLVAVATQLKEQKDTQFDYLYSLTGVDYNPELGVVYHLESTTLRHKITLVAKTGDRENPRLDTVCGIWKAAELQEREVFDLFGITFNNHPDMRRILLDEEWTGYPLRKDYSNPQMIVDLIK